MTDVCSFEPTQYTTAPHQTEGWIVFREMGHVENVILPHGVIALGKEALGNLARLIGGAEYAMMRVSHI